MSSKPMPETHRVEYKRELTPELDLEKEVIAFLNTPEGGFIYIGIDKMGQRVGVADVDGNMLKVKDRIKNNIIPRNKELMRVFKDLEMVEHLGSGLPRITEFYGPECFRFTENFLRITFAASRSVYADEETAPVAGQVTDPVEAPVEAPVHLTETERKILAAVASQPLGRSALLSALGYGQPTGNYKAAMARLLQAGLIEPTLPDKPNSRLQQYSLTDKGRSVLK